MYVTVCNRSVSYHSYEQSCKYIIYMYFATKCASETTTPYVLGICLTGVYSIDSSVIVINGIITVLLLRLTND